MSIKKHDNKKQTATMEICCKTNLAINQVASPDLTARTIKKNQLPVLDTFGPFPDETLLSSIDRVLHLCGTKGLQKFFDLPLATANIDSMSSTCSLTEQSYTRQQQTSIGSFRTAASPHSTQRSPTKHVDCENTPKRLHRKSLSASSVGVSTRSSQSSLNSRVHFNEASTISTERSMASSLVKPIKRSLSLCSLACRRLKKHLQFHTAQADECKNNWLWTRMKCYGDGYKIYEVYKSTSLNRHTLKLCQNAIPQIIFVALPNDVVVPFEPVTSH